MMDVANAKTTLDICADRKKQNVAGLISAFNLFTQIPERVKMFLEQTFGHERETNSKQNVSLKHKGIDSSLEVNWNGQLQLWKENPTWVDQSPEIKVTVPEGSLCNLKAKFRAGITPDAIYNILIDPSNSRVFKNIKEVISRKVLLDEGPRQVVEVEQAAIWRFLWWTGTFAVHVVVDQNRKDHVVKFKQGKSGFMRRFEGHWRLDPLFVDEGSCYPLKPKSLVDYDLCTKGKGRVGCLVNLEQLVEPAIIPPPPFSWYVRGIVTRTTETLINDLLKELERIRKAGDLSEDLSASVENEGKEVCLVDIKERWLQGRRNSRRNRHT